MILTVNSISKNFGDKKVLNGVTFAATSGKAFGLLGRNGAGKTTTIRIILGVFPQDEGEICLDAKQIDGNSVKIGYLPEERGLYPKKLVAEQLVYFAMLKGMKKAEATQAVDYWLEKLDVFQYRNKKLETLSKGNQQKIQLITALAHDPEVIILDEPFSGLDPVNALTLKNVIKEEIAKDKIVLFSSHQMNYVEEFCDDVAILKEGKIVLQGNLKEIKRNYPRNKLFVRSEQEDEIMKQYPSLVQKIGDDELLVTAENEENARTLTAMFTIKYRVDEIKIFEPSLNDVFVEYTK